MNAKSLAGNAAKEIFNPDVDMLKQNVERKNQNSEWLMSKESVEYAPP